MNRWLSVAVCAGVLAIASGGRGVAQPFPTRPITIVVPFPAGGTSDMLARIMAPRLTELLGQPIVIENVGGAATMIGAGRVARSSPDGHTLLIATSSTLTTNPHLQKSMRYKVSDFQPITLLARHPLAADVSNAIPVKSVSELIEFARKTPGGINYATTGRGSSAHLVGEMVRTQLKIPMKDIPYRGSAPAVTDLVSGQVHVYFDGMTTSLALHRSGKLKIVAVTAEKRSPALPEVPTFAEAGYKDVVLYNMYALMAPSGTPRAAVDGINAAVRTIMSDEAIKKRLTADGMPAEPTTPEQLAKMIADESEQMRKIITSLKISLE